MLIMSSAASSCNRCCCSNTLSRLCSRVDELEGEGGGGGGERGGEGGEGGEGGREGDIIALCSSQSSCTMPPLTFCV